MDEQQPEAGPTDLARLIAEAGGPPRPVDDFARVNPSAHALGTALAPYRWFIAVLAVAGLVALIVAAPWQGPPPPFRSTDDNIQFTALTEAERTRLAEVSGLLLDERGDGRQTLAHVGFRGQAADGPSGGMAMAVTWPSNHPMSKAERASFTRRLDDSLLGPAEVGGPLEGHVVYEQELEDLVIRVVVESGVMCLVVAPSDEFARAAMVQLIHDKVDQRV